jgi:hypothetical protein
MTTFTGSCRKDTILAAIGTSAILGAGHSLRICMLTDIVVFALHDDSSVI